MAGSESDGFSHVKGFRLQDFDVHCVQNPRVRCPNQVRLVSQMVGGVTKHSDMGEAEHDRGELVAQLRDFRLDVVESLTEFSDIDDGCCTVEMPILPQEKPNGFKGLLQIFTK